MIGRGYSGKGPPPWTAVVAGVLISGVIYMTNPRFDTVPGRNGASGIRYGLCIRQTYLRGFGFALAGLAFGFGWTCGSGRVDSIRRRIDSSVSAGGCGRSLLMRGV